MTNSNVNENEVELRKELHGIIMRFNAFALTNDPDLVADLVTEGFLQEFSRDQICEAALQTLDSELPELSKKFTGLFHQFNKEYFSNSLPEYTVTVKYVLRRSSQSSYCEGDREISLRAGSEPHMVCNLIWTMARIAAEEDEIFVKEMDQFHDQLIPGSVYERFKGEAVGRVMDRLHELGAPTWTHPDIKAISAERFIDVFKKSVVTVGNGQLWRGERRDEAEQIQ